MKSTAPLLVSGILSLCIISCSKKSDAPAQALEPPEDPVKPVITHITPSMGLPGDTIIITGSNFSASANENSVKFSGNVTAVVIGATATELKVKVPQGAATGPITVTTDNQSGTSEASFEILKLMPKDGLLAWYPLNGNAKDSSGNNYDLDLFGTYQVVEDRFGIPQRAIWFNGGNSMALGGSNAEITHPVTVACWVKYDSLMNSMVFRKFNASFNGFSISVNANTTLSVGIDGNTLQTSGTAVIPKEKKGEWIFIGFTYDGATLTLYRNNSIAGNFTLAGSITAGSDAPFRIGPTGNAGTGPEAFKVAVDDVMVYNRVLNSTEMKELYEQTETKRL
jgi:hypothetical protein